MATPMYQNYGSAWIDTLRHRERTCVADDELLDSDLDIDVVNKILARIQAR